MREDNAQEEWQSRTWRHLTTHDTNSLIMRSTVPQKEKSILPTNNDITTLFTLNPQTRVPSDLLYWYFMLTQRDRCHAVPYNLSKWINIRRKLAWQQLPNSFDDRNWSCSVLIPHFFRIISVPLRTTAKDDFRARNFFLFQTLQFSDSDDVTLTARQFVYLVTILCA